LLGVAFVALVAFGAVMTASASAELVLEPASWLVNGGNVAAGTPVETEIELLFENVLNGGGILCSVIFKGTVGPGGEDEITDILALDRVTLIAPQDPGTVGTGIKCTGEKLCNNSTEIWPAHLPILTLLRFDKTDGLYYDEILEHVVGTEKYFADYYIHCVSLITVNELCSFVAGTLMEVVNGVTDVEGGLTAFEPLGTCEGNLADGLNEDEFSLTTLQNGGGTLQLSHP